jgi:Domain of Unknown Function (DUF748)
MSPTSTRPVLRGRLGAMISRRGRAEALIAGLVALGLILVLIDVLVDEPARRWVERTANERLRGYAVRLGSLDVQLWRLGADVNDLALIQEAHPSPAIARVPRISAGLFWRALVRGKVVADVEVRRPVIHVERAQLLEEARDEVPVQKRGWQEALQAVTPIKINRLTVVDAEMTYVEDPREKPLVLSSMTFQADNIRNVRSRERTYPSEITLDAVVFGSGRLSARGAADFLAVPHPALRVDLEMGALPLDYFKPVAARYNVQVNQGTFSAAGRLEYAPSFKLLHLSELTARDLRGDYVHTPSTAGAERRRAERVGQAAAAAINAPGLLVRIDRARLTGVVGFVNQAARPAYHVFLGDASIEVENLSNHLTAGRSIASVKGRFMGSGATTATATFRPERHGADFDLAVKIEDTQVRDMNDLLRAYAGVDVVDGLFTLVAELSVKNRTVSGYVKPLFRNLDVYHAAQDRKKNPFRQTYEAVVGGVAHLLKSRPREEVATRATITGRLENPRSSTLEIIMGLVQNAFFRAILPQFEQELALVRRRR